MFYYLYEIKNHTNDKIYRGVHKTEKIDDGYMGSGAAICKAIRLEGIDNFSKIILETFENSDDMYAREREVVNKEFLSRPDVYNIQPDGGGGWNLDSEQQAKAKNRKIEIYGEDYFSRIASIPKSASHKANIAEAINKLNATYAVHPNLGKKRQIVQCPHCAKTGAINGMQQWHFDKCKHRV
jgi:hypothetical protein